MNKICKKYISEIKALFPINRKQEKEYLKKLTSDIEDFCEETGAAEKGELYKNYGTPQEVVSNYLLTLDSQYVAKRIRTTRIIKGAVAVGLVLATIATSVYGVHLFITYQDFLDNQCGGVVTVISNYN
ncbi:MAG: hypothetical protein IJD19_01405 [Ruminococcus sp.]|nr:hypothetical protein [Ruminococcus sp.]